jgi:hypothetical protein
MYRDCELMDLLRRMVPDLPEGPEALRAVLEASLLPLIRCALRAGVGRPALVRWVRHEAARYYAGLAPAQAARPLARTLCDRLLGLDPRSQRDTVAEPVGGTVVRAAGSRTTPERRG